MSRLNKLYFSLIFGIFLLLNSPRTLAQQSPQFSIFSANSNSVNPAFSGWKSNNYVALQVRDQWSGYTTSTDGSGTLGTTWIAGSFGITPKGGIGLQFYSDKTPSGVTQQSFQIGWDNRNKRENYSSHTLVSIVYRIGLHLRIGFNG